MRTDTNLMIPGYILGSRKYPNSYRVPQEHVLSNKVNLMASEFQLICLIQGNFNAISKGFDAFADSV